MTRVKHPSNRWCVWLALAATTAVVAQAEEPMYLPNQAVPGGLLPEAVIQSMEATDGQTIITGKGLLPPFNLQVSDQVEGGTWTRVLTNVTTMRYFAFTNDAMGEVVFYRVEGRGPNYAGSQACKFCHDILNPGLHGNFMMTKHAEAYDNLPAFAKTNPGCIPCHTVGFGQPTGYVIGDSSQHNILLRGVQCENCHGPAADHALNPYDESTKPAITIAAETCGGCHTDAHHPTYDEWLEAGHSTQSEDFEFAGSGANRQGTCATCHSGGARMASVKGFEDGVDPVYNGEDSDNFAITCVVCHDPHEKSEDGLKPAQLRYPTASGDYFTYSTSKSFASQYNPNIQVCAQCHNHRGATFTSTGRPPHHSPQYNILIGQLAAPGSADGDLFNGGPMGHGDPYANEVQCVKCHMHPESVESPTEEDPNYTGHTFELQLSACGECHIGVDESGAEGGIEFIQSSTRGLMAKTIAALDNWAATKIPNTPANAEFFKDNCVPWEFGTIGQLNTGKVSPNTAAQGRIPLEIKQARTLLYFVEHDGSYGVHNVYYVKDILAQAKNLADNAPAIPEN